MADDRSAVSIGSHPPRGAAPDIDAGELVAVSVGSPRAATGAGPDAPAHRRPEPEPTPRSPGHRHRMRPVDGWDVLGLVLTTLVMLGVHHGARALVGVPLGRSPVLDAATAVVAATAGALLVVLVLRDRPRPGALPRLVTAVWADPPGDWVALPLGAVLALPLFGLYTRVLLQDADSARVIAAVTHVRTHGIDFLVDTQDNFGPHILLGPVVAVAGLAGAKAVAVISVQALAGVTAYVTRRITGSMLGAAAAAVALVAIPPVVDRGGFVPLYPVMLALGYLGGWLAYQAVTQPDRRWLRAAAAGVCLALAPEAQAVGQLFLAAPLLLLVLAPGWRAGLAACGRIYLFVALTSIPRIAVNVADGGLSRITSYRTDYWITEGYVSEIQTGFWEYTGVDEPLRVYLGLLPGRFAGTLGTQGCVVLGVALAAWLLACRLRGRLLVLAVVGTMLLAVSLKQVPPFPRYYSPLWPGIAILAGVGVAGVVRRRSRLTGAVAVGAVLALAALAGSTLRDAVRIHDVHRAAVEAGPYSRLAEQVDDGKGVIGARSHSLLNVTADIPTWGGQFLTEDEYVTYLTWPSDAAVIEVMERHDIGWVLVHGTRILELDYHDTWLIPHHGRPARQVDQVAASPAFCRHTEVDGYVLYRLGPCTGGE
jgi:hypothetical protein